ncbi:hypothetical protein [Actinopolyspora mortivallis]|uniref:hypothetical protein n=1 Tax=Actinopolyspora mortivallis TaxID=33906 RepID=UPI00037A4D96|nr:hypothetical protein [Actinopolyspora mortivallis]
MADHENRWGDSGMSPRLDHRGHGYPSRPQGPRVAAPLVMAGHTLGWIWTDQQQAAGWSPASPTNEVSAGLISRAHAHVYARLVKLHRQGVPASDVLNAENWAPHTLGPIDRNYRDS